LRNIIAKYQIEDTFKITGRGIIFAGKILDGEFRIGDSMKFEFNSEIIERKIIGIEGIRSTAEKPNTGILIKCINEKEIDELRNWSPNLTIAEIYSKNEP